MAETARAHSAKRPKRIPEAERLSFRLANLTVAAVADYLSGGVHGRPQPSAVEAMEVLVERIIRRELGRYASAEPVRPPPMSTEEVGAFLRRHLPKVACEGCKRQQGAALLQLARVAEEGA